MYRHARFGAEGIFVPHQLVDLAARIDASGRPDKELQDVEFQRRQRNALAVHRHALGVLVECHAADGVDAALRRGLRLCAEQRIAPKLRFHASQHLHGVKGLGDVIVRADVQSEHLVAALALRREQDDGRVALAPDRRRRGNAVQLRHHDVHEDKVDVILPHGLDRLRAVVGFKDAVLSAG